MATIVVRDEGGDGAGDRRITDVDEIREFLGQFGIWYRYEPAVHSLPDEATDDDVLELFAEPIAKLKEEGGYVTADVINITPDIDGLDAMLAKFSSEHYHTEDEVRFIVDGRGLFHINPRKTSRGDARSDIEPKDVPVFAIEVEKGDLINVPLGTHHWFDLCEDRRIRAVRLFQDRSGWTPHYTESGVDKGFIPICFGPEFVMPLSEAKG